MNPGGDSGEDDDPRPPKRFRKEETRLCDSDPLDDRYNLPRFAGRYRRPSAPEATSSATAQPAATSQTSQQLPPSGSSGGENYWRNPERGQTPPSFADTPIVPAWGGYGPEQFAQRDALRALAAMQPSAAQPAGGQIVPTAGDDLNPAPGRTLASREARVTATPSDLTSLSQWGTASQAATNSQATGENLEEEAEGDAGEQESAEPGQENVEHEAVEEVEEDEEDNDQENVTGEPESGVTQSSSEQGQQGTPDDPFVGDSNGHGSLSYEQQPK